MKKVACIVLPTYNEAENVQIVIPLIFEQASRIETHELHVLVVDDDSPDGTQEAVKSLQGNYLTLHLITGRKEGLGEAYKRGMKHAIEILCPEIIFEMDADLQHDPSLLPLFLTLSNFDFDLIIGSRFAPGGSTPDFSLWRKFLSRFGNWMIRFIGGLPRIHDCTSGYRCIRVDLLERCDLSFLSTRGYSFQASLLCELLRNGARVIEVPMTFPDRIHGESKLSLHDQIEFLLNIFKIRFRQSQEFIKFCAVGASGVLVNMGIYILLTRAGGLDLEFASPIAIETSILSNFLLNNVWTFKQRKTQTSWLQKLWKFHAVAAAAGITNYCVLLFLAKLLGVWDIIANLVGIGVGTLVNYSMNSLWTWKETTRDGGSGIRGKRNQSCE